MCSTFGQVGQRGPQRQRVDDRLVDRPSTRIHGQPIDRPAFRGATPVIAHRPVARHREQPAPRRLHRAHPPPVHDRLEERVLRQLLGPGPIAAPESRARRCVTVRSSGVVLPGAFRAGRGQGTGGGRGTGWSIGWNGGAGRDQVVGQLVGGMSSWIRPFPALGRSPQPAPTPAPPRPGCRPRARCSRPERAPGRGSPPPPGRTEPPAHRQFAEATMAAFPVLIGVPADRLGGRGAHTSHGFTDVRTYRPPRISPQRAVVASSRGSPAGNVVAMTDPARRTAPEPSPRSRSPCSTWRSTGTTCPTAERAPAPPCSSSTAWPAAPHLARDDAAPRPRLRRHRTRPPRARKIAKPLGDYWLGAFASGLRDLLAVLGVERHDRGRPVAQRGIAVQLAYQHPELCERLVLVGGAQEPSARRSILILRMLALPGAELLMPLLFPSRFRPRDRQRGRSFLAATSLRSPRLSEMWRASSLAVPRPPTALLPARPSDRSSTPAARPSAPTTASTWLPPSQRCSSRAAPDGIIPIEHAYEPSTLMPGSPLKVFGTWATWCAPRSRSASPRS